MYIDWRIVWCFFFVEQIIMVDVTVNFVNFGYSFLFLVELILGLNRIG